MPEEVVTERERAEEDLTAIWRLVADKKPAEEILPLIREIVGPKLIDTPISQGLVAKLTQDACFAADTVAISNRYTEMTNAQQTRAIIHRALEFLIANDVVRIVDHGDDGRWMTIDPPYDVTKLEPSA